MRHRLVSDKLEVMINFFGAEICSVKNKEGLEFIWQAQKEVWPRHAPVLFPIVGKLKDNSFLFNGKRYELSQHGFARDRSFELKEHSDSACTFELRSDQMNKEAYPFDFVFHIRYQLVQNRLTTYYKVINPSRDRIFFSVGAHPGFNCPLLPSESFENYYLEFESSGLSLTELDQGLRKVSKTTLSLSDKKLFLSKALFEKDALVFEGSQIHKISLCSNASSHKINLSCENWPYFGIWAKKDCDKFVCLEPWYGIADAEHVSGELTQKQGIIALEAGKEFHCSFSVSFD